VRSPVGIFDSGIGGLTVWREIERRSPHVDTLYVADQSHLPYGARDEREILGFARGITRFLVGRGCRVIVVACNTASAVALRALRREFPGVQFVGMEPAIKPAAELSRSGVVAVLATPTTLRGALFEQTAAGVNGDVEIVRQACPGLVECIEAGSGTAVLERLLTKLLRAPRDAGADTIVLGCTHYPFVRRLIQSIVGPTVHIVDPAAAVARQVQRVTSSGAALGPGNQPAARHTFHTTGEAEAFARVAEHWLGVAVVASALRWSRRGLEELAPLRSDPPEAPS
jgi:glutamate racemase